MLQKSKDKEYSNFWQASSQEQTKLSLWAFATKYRGDYCFFLFQFQFKQTNISHLGLRRCEAKNWGFLEHIQCLGSIDTIEHALALCWSWVSSSLHSASWRSSHPPPDARAHALHLVHLRLRGVTEHISAKPVVTWCDLWDFFFLEDSSYRSDARRENSGGDGGGAGADEEGGDGERLERHRERRAAPAPPEPRHARRHLRRARPRPPRPPLRLLPAAAFLHLRRR